MNWTSPGVPLWMLLWAAAAWLPPPALGRIAMPLVSIGFLAWADLRSCLALTAAAILAGLLLRGSRPGRLRIVSVLAVALAGLIWAKWGLRLDDDVPAVLGAAFAAVRLVHVAVEVWCGRLAVDGPMAMLRYILLFPSLIAGPIHRMEGQERDGRRRRWDARLAAAGMERILYGFVKIVFCAGWVAYKCSYIETGEWNACAEAWFTCLRYGWDLYFQFSGYSDIAIGLGLFAGYRLPENFAFPFLAADLPEFWRRWHASLSAWCRSYVAEPVMAWSRCRWLAIVVSMLVLGLWHELSLRYCVWGLFHGIGIVCCQHFRAWTGQPNHAGALGRSRRAMAILLTQGFVIMSFAITSSSNLQDAGRLILRMLGMAGR